MLSRVILPTTLGLALVAGGCATERQSVQLDRERERFVGDAVTRIMQALQEYAADHSSIPQSLEALVPKYIEEDALWILGTDSPCPDGARLLLLGNPIPDPEDPSIRMLAFLCAVTDGTRFVVTDEFRGLVVGEAKFQYWIAGHPIAEGPNSLSSKMKE